jgi:hypothetical protein
LHLVEELAGVGGEAFDIFALALGDDLPLPLRPVMTTSLSRGIFSVRFLRLCSRAPPILMNSLLTAPKFPNQTIDKFTGNLGRSKGEPRKCETPNGSGSVTTD